MAALASGECASALGAQAAPTVEPLVIERVTVVDVGGGRLIRDRTVIVEGNRIAAVIPSAGVRPRKARVVDGRGQFLIPGLWDMHVHTVRAGRAPTYFPLFVANGVTAVRDMASETDSALRWRAEVASGRTLGPRIVASGPLLDGRPPMWPEHTIPTGSAEEGRHGVDSLRRAGMDFVKVHTGLARDVYFAVADQARRQGLSFVGHVPNAVSALEASDAGQRSIEHLWSVLLGCSRDELRLREQAVQATMAPDGPNWNLAHAAAERRSVGSYDTAKADALFAKFVRNGTWQVPTLVYHRAFAYFADTTLINDSRLKYVSHERQEQWHQRLGSPADSLRGDSTTRKLVFEVKVAVVGAMYRAGVGILAGTDVAAPYVLPGFSLHDELALLVKAGLTPLEALRTAILKPAVFLAATDSLGGIERGKVADLVLLDADPLADIRNTKRIRGVVVNGRYLDRAALDALLTEVERRVASGR